MWALAAVVTVVATRSSTALLVTAAVGAVGLSLVVLLLLAPGLRRVVAVPLLAGAGLLVWFATANLDTVARSVGRDPTLTGRTDIWSVVLQAVADRPVQGYGWSALWHAGTPVTERMWAQGGFACSTPTTATSTWRCRSARSACCCTCSWSRACCGARPGLPGGAVPGARVALFVLAVVLAYNASETSCP